jgi:hypothetical protein
MVTPMPIDSDRLLIALRREDLMGTGCMLNGGMENEYELEAYEIARRVKGGQPLRDSFIATFDDQFWSGCLSEGTRLTSLDQLLSKLKL